MAHLQNSQNVPLSLAVWLAHDEYDYRDDPNHLSATSLLKSTRQIILSARVTPEDQPTDISALVPSRMGSAIHNGIESAWLNNYQNSLVQLGYPQRVVERILINPSPEQLGPDSIPIYLEQRSEKQIEGFTISGKFDFVGDGRVEDFKTTSTYTYQNKTNDEKYILQGSIYRWLNPEIITRDEMAIQFLFTDWSALRARTERDKGYPGSRTLEYRLPLMSIQETEAWVRRKLQTLKQYQQATESDLPPCTDEELWRSEPVYKYYKNPAKMSRSTKNFASLAEANLRFVEDGSVGIVVEQKGSVTACKYCPAFAACKQKDAYLASGELVI